MNEYKTAVDFRRALEARLKVEAQDTGSDYGRLRRIVVFDRIGARLSASDLGWVLKGGTALEFRLGLRARATKDLDLVLRSPLPDGAAVREVLIETLAADVDNDRFVFNVGHPVALDTDAAGNPGWRFSVDGTLAGKTFTTIRVDIVFRPVELAATERISLPGKLEFAGIRPRTIESADRRQHFAEKLHAFTRDYGLRPNTRVKDLVDLLLLIHDGLLPDQDLVTVVRHVFTVRGTHPVPASIPDPPPAWRDEYPSLAANAALDEHDLPAALDTLRAFWTRTTSTGATT
ncbi:MAG TPA: nucleotidyl transferase AbiEii/AbiGii toxin family protein [Streptosporangiaceae bacterium]|nr:nucleotidyl transferase AbiEii/AbiGii toxin family protein [Streptosporangiaceae bacterium]